MIEAAALFAAVVLCATVLATWTLRSDIRAISADVKDLDDRLAKIEARYGGRSFSEMLVGDTSTG